MPFVPEQDDTMREAEDAPLPGDDADEEIAPADADSSEDAPRVTVLEPMSTASASSSTLPVELRFLGTYNRLERLGEAFTSCENSRSEK